MPTVLMETKARALSGRLQARWIRSRLIIPGHGAHHVHHPAQGSSTLPHCLFLFARPLVPPPSLWGTGQASHPLFPASLLLTGPNTFMTEVRGTAGRQQGGTCCRDRRQLRHKCYCHSHHTSGPGRKEIRSYQGNR